MANLKKIMKKTQKLKRLFLLAAIFCNVILMAQAPAVAWQKCIGTTGTEVVKSFQRTADGGYIMAGTIGTYGYYNYYIVKLDASGTVQWEKSIGDESDDQALSIKQTTDGGYIVLGDSRRTYSSLGTYRGFWIIKLDASGEQQWETAIGGGGLGMTENTYDIQLTTDGGYVFTGIKAFTGKGQDFYIAKLNSTGAIIWQKNYGGPADDYVNSIRQTTDGGYVVAGQTYSNSGDVTGQHGNGDFWIIKLNALGELEWQKALGGTGVDFASTIELTADGGYIAAGFASSNSGDVSGVYGNADFWIVKLSATGTIQWQKAYGGDNADKVSSIKPTLDGGYIVAGRTNSNNSGYITGHHGSGLDVWIVKINSLGVFQWQKTLGGFSDDTASEIIQNSDGSYTIAGITFSNDGDVSGNHGSADIWLVNLFPEVLASETFNEKTAVIYPNPVTNILKIQIPGTIQKIVIFDTTGKKIAEQNSDSNQVDVAGLQRGMYTIRIQTSGKMITQKFIKE